MRLRSGVDLTVVWAAVAALIWLLAWEHLYVAGATIKKKKKKKSKKKKKDRHEFLCHIKVLRLAVGWEWFWWFHGIRNQILWLWSMFGLYFSEDLMIYLSVRTPWYTLHAIQWEGIRMIMLTLLLHPSNVITQKLRISLLLINHWLGLIHIVTSSKEI